MFCDPLDLFVRFWYEIRALRKYSQTLVTDLLGVGGIGSRRRPQSL